MITVVLCLGESTVPRISKIIFFENICGLLHFLHPLGQIRHILFKLVDDGSGIGRLPIEIICQGDHKLFVSVDLLLLRIDLDLELSRRGKRQFQTTCGVITHLILRLQVCLQTCHWRQ